jgi:hypothetical protein
VPLVVVVREKPVSAFFSVAEAVDKTAPEGSVTVPVISPEVMD